MSKKPESEKNLPSVSKQTAGGITGAVIGGMVAGPVGAVAGGIAGALVGDSSAKGNEPIQKTIETIRSTGMRGAKAIKAARDRNKLSRSAKEPTKGSAAKTAASTPASWHFSTSPSAVKSHGSQNNDLRRHFVIASMRCRSPLNISRAAKPALAKQKLKAKPATKKVPNAAKSKVAAKPKAKGAPKLAKKKA